MIGAWNWLMSSFRLSGAVPPLVAFAVAVFRSNLKWKCHLRRLCSVDLLRFLPSSSPLLLFTVSSVWTIYVCSIAIQCLIFLAAAIYSLALFSFPHSQHIAVCKAIHVQAWTGPEGCRRLRLPEFLGIWHLKVTRLTALYTGRLYIQEILLVFFPVRGWVKHRMIVQMEKPQWPHRKTKLRPTALQQSVSTNCATEYFVAFAKMADLHNLNIYVVKVHNIYFSASFQGPKVSFSSIIFEIVSNGLPFLPNFVKIIPTIIIYKST